MLEASVLFRFIPLVSVIPGRVASIYREVASAYKRKKIDARISEQNDRMNITGQQGARG